MEHERPAGVGHDPCHLASGDSEMLLLFVSFVIFVCLADSDNLYSSIFRGLEMWGEPPIFENFTPGEREVGQRVD